MPESEGAVASGGEAGAAPGPLRGVRVLDLTSVVMGPMATQILGDLGADVIAVESGRGETNRIMGPGPHPELSGIALNLLRNKRNVALDLKAADGRAALLRIAATCDILVTNLRPGPLERLGLAYDDVRVVRPDVIFCRAQGFPSDSERAEDPAYDDIIQAASGMTDVVRRASGTPAQIPSLIADKVSALTIVYAITAALYHRERTGEGQEIEVPMIDAFSAFVLVEHGAGAIARPRVTTAGYPRILTPDRHPQRTADGWAALFPYTPAQVRALLGAGREPGAEAAVADATVADAASVADAGAAAGGVAAGGGAAQGGETEPAGATMAAYRANPGLLYRELDAVAPARTTAEWLAFCRDEGIPASAVVDLDDLVDALPEAHHPDAGDYKVIPPPVRFSASPAAVRRPAPLAGQHNHEVLAEVGLSDAEIEALIASGTLR
jgi:crotonobetainyl-CoA:carnitine CoA-transferase CaiB-like acyl-CoA transferase